MLLVAVSAAFLFIQPNKELLGFYPSTRSHGITFMSVPLLYCVSISVFVKSSFCGRNSIRRISNCGHTNRWYATVYSAIGQRGTHPQLVLSFSGMHKK